MFLLSAAIGMLAVTASAQTAAPPRGAVQAPAQAPAPARGTTQAPARGTTQAPARGTTQAPAGGAAQAPARGATPPPASAGAASPSSTPTAAAQAPRQAAAAPPPPPYTYQVGGRRDPFRNLLPPARSAGPAATVASTAPEKIEGPKDINVSDITVKGVLQSGSTYVAMVLGPNGKTYVVHQGDSLRNGTIRSITPQGLVIVQDVNDPLSTQRQREVRKLLRSFEEAK